MRIVKPMALKIFWTKWPAAEKPLQDWYAITRNASWRHFTEVKADFSHADLCGKCVIFDIGGNKFRLIAAIHYNRGILYIRNVLNHKEYDKGGWKDDCDCN